MEVIKEIAEELQINFILPKIDKFINEYDNFSKMIDNQQKTVDSIDELFGWLYDIKKNTVESVKSSILNSNWIKTEDEVIELAAFILQVINSSFELHPYILNLLLQLDKEADESNNKLNILVPFVAKQLLFRIGENFCVCSFIYNLYKKKIIKKETILEKINDLFNPNPQSTRSSNSQPVNYDKKKLIENIQFWFLSELVELKLTHQLDKFVNKNLSERPAMTFSESDKKEKSFLSKFINSYYPDKIDLYNKMRDKGEPEDELTKSLRADDVDKVQSILTKSDVDYSNFTLPFNIFDNFADKGRMILINYAAAYGSLKCFKYLMLNSSTFDELTFKYAVYGRNTEIIKIVDQNAESKQKKNQGFSFLSMKSIKDSIPAISKNKNDLFDWIFEQKYKDSSDDCSRQLLLRSISNGNAHAFIEIIDKSLPTSDCFQILLIKAAENGFYKLTKLIYEILCKKSHLPLKELRNDDNFYSIFASFGNLSIFQFGLQLNDKMKKKKITNHFQMHYAFV